MQNISKEQIRNLYAIASKLNILVQGSKDDDFHNLVYSITGKSSVSQLTGAQYYKVRDRLIAMQLRKNKADDEQNENKSNDKKNNTASKSTNNKNNKDRKNKEYKKKKVAPITDEQIGKIWYLMYEFEKVSPSSASVGVRLKGIIKRQFKIDVNVKEPFVWLTYKDGYRLIEILKKYVANKKDIGIYKGSEKIG